MGKINTIYDANIWNKLSYEDIAYWVTNSHSFLIDDTAIELYIAGKMHCNNEGFNRKLSLAFNAQWGLNDEFTLVLFEIPWKQPIVYENSMHTMNPKNDAFSCSLYHYWLQNIISPATIIEPLICLNSALSIELIKPNDPKTLQEIESDKNRIRQGMLKKYASLFESSGIGAKTLIRSWKKRDDSIKNGTLTLTDYREVLFALVKIVTTCESAVILTADYDIVDIQNNLYLSIIDQYIVQMIMMQKIKEGFVIEEKSKSILIDRHSISQKVEEICNRIEAEKEYVSMKVMLYSDKDSKLYPFENKYPVWLLRFLCDYRGNSNCLSMPYNPNNLYQIRYIWHMETLSSEEGIRFDVWLDGYNDKKILLPFTPMVLSGMSEEEQDKEKNKACFPMICKPFCEFEHEEYNYAKSLSPFVKDY